MKPHYEYDPINGASVKMPGQDFLQQGVQLMGKLVGDVFTNYNIKLQPLIGVKDLRFVQKPDWLECICPCILETANNYRLTSSDPTGISELFEVGDIIEETQCFGKFCCQSCRPNTLRMVNKQGEQVFEAKRDYKIPAVCCCPCSRPEVFVTQGGNPIGSVRQPYMCCGRSSCPCPILEEMDIYDEKDNLLYFISAPLCQCGAISRIYRLPRCCGPCQFINFDIHTPDKEKVGVIRNIYNGCLLECCTKADKFVVCFPQKASSRDKLLLINACLQIDYDQFENTCNNLP